VHDIDLALADGGVRTSRRIANALAGNCYVLDRERDVGRALLDVGQGQIRVDVARFRGPDLHADLLDRDYTINAMAVELAGVLAEGRRSRQRERYERSGGVTVQEMNRQELKAIPGVAEPDPMKSVEVLPGVTRVSDFTAAFNVRGGSADQNLILLDGMPIFNPFHALGLFSVFNGDMVQRAELHSGGFPAEYGGRTSSVLKVESDLGDG